MIQNKLYSFIFSLQIIINAEQSRHNGEGTTLKDIFKDYIKIGKD